MSNLYANGWEVPEFTIKMAKLGCGWAFAPNPHWGVEALNDMAKFRGTEYSEHCRSSAQNLWGKTVSRPPLVHIADFAFSGKCGGEMRKQ
jgi:hypothetical protein